MELDVQAVIDELLEQNKQLSMQLAVARATISQLKDQISQPQPPPSVPADEKNQS